jgi:hypothetical protein
MKLTQGQKILIGVLTLLPFLFVPYLIFQVFSFVMTTVSNDSMGIDPQPEIILSAIFSFIFPIILLSLLSLALFIFYIIHTVNNKNMETTERIIWILLFIFVGLVVFPVYWIMRIWNDGQQSPVHTR